MSQPFLALAAGVAALVFSGCKPAAPPAGKGTGVPVLTARVVVTNVPVQINPPPFGHVLPISTVTIRSQIGGLIQKVHFQEGQEVKKGDLLFTIDPRPSQAALDSAQAALVRDSAQMENARIQCEREQKLFAQKLVSEDEYFTSKAAYDALTGTVQSDHAAITNAELNLEFTAIRSPIDGRTGSLQFHEGNVVKAPDDVLLSINQIHPIYAAFAVPERYLPEITRQMRDHRLSVTAQPENLAATGAGETGDLTFVDNSVDPATGTIQLKATFANAADTLWPGQYVHIALTLSELTNVVTIPAQAVQKSQTGEFVYVVKADQTVEARPVQTGLINQSVAVIQSGLSPQETVVTDGQLRLAPGFLVSEKDEPAGTGTP